MPFNCPPWHPMSNPVDLKHLGKLAEELGELQAAVARCMIQGIDEVEPVTGKPNRKWIEEEVADVLANITLVEMRFKLNIDDQRIARKIMNLQDWHKDA